MSENAFGYEPAPLPSYIAQYDDYAAGQSIDYRPTPWDDFGQVNIETMWTWIQNESDEKTRAVAEMWRRIGVLLEATRANVKRYGDSLDQAWQSPAASEFLRQVGAALYSLEEWNRAAVGNASALNTVANKISSTQTQMRDVWQRYTATAADAERRREEEKNDSIFMSAVRGFTEDPPTHDEVRREFTNQAKPVMRALAETYTDSALSLERGSTFKGPVEANGTYFSGGGSGSGGSGGGGYGWGGGSGPAAPAGPSVPSPSGAPLPELAGMLPPPPNSGLALPGTPLPPGPVPAPPGGQPPMPGLPMPPVPGPRPPGTPNPPSMPRPGPGNRLPTPPGETPGRTPPVARPNLPGASPRTGVPAPPSTSPSPGTPRRPNLLGTRNATPVPPRPPVPGTGVPTEPTTIAAPRLDGRHGSRPAGPVRAGTPGPGTPGLGRPGLPSAPMTTSPNLAGRRKADTSGTPTVRPTGRRGRGSTSQVLGGRTAPVNDTVAGRPHGPQLGDRKGTAERSTRAGGSTKRQRRQDDDLWTVDGAQAAVEAPAPKPSANPGATGRHAE